MSQDGPKPKCPNKLQVVPRGISFEGLSIYLWLPTIVSYDDDVILISYQAYSISILKLIVEFL